MKPLQLLRDCMGQSIAAGLVAGDVRLVVQLAANGNANVAVPNGARSVLFSATDEFWVSYGSSAAVPTGAILDGSAPELNPVLRGIGTATVLGVAAPRACVVNLSFYS